MIIGVCVPDPSHPSAPSSSFPCPLPVLMQPQASAPGDAAAATKIQAKWRGHTARKSLKKTAPPTRMEPPAGLPPDTAAPPTERADVPENTVTPRDSNKVDSPHAQQVCVCVRVDAMPWDWRMQPQHWITESKRQKGGRRFPWVSGWGAPISKLQTGGGLFYATCKGCFILGGGGRWDSSEGQECFIGGGWGGSTLGRTMPDSEHAAK